MLESQFFSKYLRILRISHSLSTNDLAQLLNLKSKGTIYNLENSITRPSIEVFEDMVHLFGVSANWLLGYTDDPYDENILSTIEQELLWYQFEFNNQRFAYLSTLPWIPKEYLDEDLRQKTYSLPVRANLVFLLHNYLAYQQSALSDAEFAQKSFLHLKCVEWQRYYRILNNPDTYAKKQKQRDFYIKSLQELLAAKNDAKPIFDIQAQKTTEE